jgi:hypothetical protein
VCVGMFGKWHGQCNGASKEGDRAARDDIAALHSPSVHDEGFLIERAGSGSDLTCRQLWNQFLEL